MKNKFLKKIFSVLLLSSAASYSSISFSSEKNHFNAYQKLKYPIVANSLQQNYQKNQNRIKSCNTNTAQFTGNPKIEFLTEGSTYYYCILDDNAIMRFEYMQRYKENVASGLGVDKQINKFTAPKKIGFLRKKIDESGGYESVPCIFSPGNSTQTNCGYYKEPSSTEYVIENDALIKYKCYGSYSCDNPSREVLALKNPNYKPSNIESKILNKSKETAFSRSENNANDFILSMLINIILPLVAIVGFTSAFLKVGK